MTGLRTPISLALLMLALVATPAAARPAIVANIDLSGPQQVVADQAAALADALSAADGKIIDLNLTVTPTVDGDVAEYGVTVQSGKDRAPLRCDSSWERLETPTAFAVGFNGAYNHLLLEILNADPRMAPMLTVACEYRGGSPTPVFHLRGRYVVSVIAIPTAWDIQLRPVTGPPLP